MNIEIGQTAPDFILYDSDKNKVTLSELKGQPVLLLFFHWLLPVSAQKSYVR